ncbi:MAG: 23S rRNA (pseudouridine(1915)-N(3))-methyltransferase RlmH [Bacteroidales bacterium]|nr:23S rRNA (pseudouridine(1915)-N(3))-methyltransferase RlmH [Bacteroidales bacterium]
MKVRLIYIGKEDSGALEGALESYVKKIRFYLPFEMEAVPYLKNTKLSMEEQKRQEGAGLLRKIDASDYVVLLDEHGKELSSVAFSKFMQQQMSSGRRCLDFVIGGAYGFSDEVRQRADTLLSLSAMTFPHILTRLIFAEQLYRAMTIIRGEPYHHV